MTAATKELPNIAAALAGLLQKVAAKHQPLLIALAERLAAELLKQRGVMQVTVRVTKRPPLPHLRAFTVEITRPL